MRSTGRLWRAGQFRLRPAGLHRSECMEARAKLLGHPIHQMVIVLPLGLLTTAVIFDVIHLLGGGPQWSQEIGRASCRERVYISGGGVSLDKNHNVGAQYSTLRVARLTYNAHL